MPFDLVGAAVSTRQGSPEVPPTRQRGRPRVEQPMEPVMTRLPRENYDRLVRAADLQGLSVSSLVRQLLILRIPKE